MQSLIAVKKMTGSGNEMSIHLILIMRFPCQKNAERFSKKKGARYADTYVR